MKTISSFLSNQPMLAFCLSIFALVGCGANSGNSGLAGVKNADGMVFENKDDALKEIKAAFKSEDPNRLVAIYGTIGKEIIVTGDPVADSEFMRKISRKLDQRAELLPYTDALHPGEEWYKLRFSIEGWNMRIPLVNRGKGWVFATEYAKEAAQEFRRELNEVYATDTLFLLVTAQRQYIQKDRDGDGVMEYAQKIISSPGKRDGLYWDPALGGEASPLDGVAARAIDAGYTITGKGNQYYGYKYKILMGKARGQRGSVESFLKGDNMVNGFAIMAYPANWNVSGAQTFVVDVSGRMYKKDLGFKTDDISSEMSTFIFDNTWVKVEHPELGLRL